MLQQDVPGDAPRVLIGPLKVHGRPPPILALEGEAEGHVVGERIGWHTFAAGYLGEDAFQELKPPGPMPTFLRRLDA
jgi:hypothetical protein